jgi:hypothetical protein
MQRKSSKRPVRTRPTVELGARGPRGEAGFLLHGALPEAVEWDLENEIVSSRRFRLEKEGWWVASSYFDTTLDIALRFFPSVLVRYPEGEERVVDADDAPEKKQG